MGRKENVIFGLTFLREQERILIKYFFYLWWSPTFLKKVVEIFRKTGFWKIKKKQLKGTVTPLLFCFYSSYPSHFLFRKLCMISRLIQFFFLILFLLIYFLFLPIFFPKALIHAIIVIFISKSIITLSIITPITSKTISLKLKSAFTHFVLKYNKKFINIIIY